MKLLTLIILLTALLAPSASTASSAKKPNIVFVLADEIVAMDLLTVKEPKSEAESRLRVIRLTTRGGSTGYGDYLDYGLPAENEEEILARLVNRYAEQGHKQNIFLTDPSMRAVGSGHTVIGQTANDVLHAKTRE